MRTTITELLNLARYTNESLDRRGSDARVVISSRNGYRVIDLTTAEYVAEGNGRTVRTLRAGASGSLAAYLRAMREALMLVDDFQREPEPAGPIPPSDDTHPDNDLGDEAERGDLDGPAAAPAEAPHAGT